jgi:hypothetical protein
MLPPGVSPIKQYDTRVEGNDVTYTTYTGQKPQPKGEWGDVGDLFQDDSKKPTHVWFHDKSGWQEGAIDITPHPKYHRKLVLGVTRGRARWLNPTTMRTRRFKKGFQQENADGNDNEEEEPKKNGGMSGTVSAEKASQGGKRRVSLERESDEDAEVLRDFDGREGTPAEKRRKLCEKGEEVGVIAQVPNVEVDRNQASGAGQGKFVNIDAFSVSDLQCTSPANSKNDWILPLLHAWSHPPFSLLPRWEDGLRILNALEKHSSAIPEYNKVIPFGDIRFEEPPSMSHIIEDIFQTPMEDFSIIDQGMRQSADSGITKSQFLANFIEADAIRVKSAATRLYSIVDLRFHRDGSHQCGLRVPEYVDSPDTLVEDTEHGLSWGSTIAPLGSLTDIHYDYHGPAQLMVGIKCYKLWLIWPPTPNNLEWYSTHYSRIPTGVETVEAIERLEGLRYLIQRSGTAFILPPYHLHAVLSFEASAHCGICFWNVSTWEEFACQGMDWELGWAKNYASKGHGIECAIDLIQGLAHSVKTFDSVAKLKGNGYRQLAKWVGPMSTRISAVAMGLGRKKSRSVGTNIVS